MGVEDGYLEQDLCLFELWGLHLLWAEVRFMCQLDRACSYQRDPFSILGLEEVSGDEVDVEGGSELVDEASTDSGWIFAVEEDKGWVGSQCLKKGMR
ncbi:hypothetical protein Tco_0712213 [Tanacetum coccineum]